MHHARPSLLFVLVLAAPLLAPRLTAQTAQASAAASAADLSIYRSLVDESNAARKSGDYAGAREMALEVVTYLLARPLAEQDAAWIALLHLGGFAAYEAQDLRTANSAWKRVYEVFSATLPDDHPDLQVVRGNLAATLSTLGELAGARALEEQVLAVRSRTLPGDHPDLQAARANLAATLHALGELAGARALKEQVLAVFSRTLPGDHPDLQKAQGMLALTLSTLGDLAGARALEEQVLAVGSRTLPGDHPDLQKARKGLAKTLYMLGDLAGARALMEQVLAVYSRTLPGDHPELQRARQGLAVTILALGDLAGARALMEQVLAVCSRTLPGDHPELQEARQGLAVTILKLGDLAGARALQEQVLAVCSRTLPGDNPDLQLARQNLAATIMLQLVRASHSPRGEGEKKREREEARERCVELIGDLSGAQVHAARAAILGSPARESEERCASFAKYLDVSLSFAQGYDVLGPLVELESRSFAFGETMRGAALASAALTRRAARSPKYAELREALSEASAALAGLAQQGTTSEEFDRARVKRESVERDLVALARELSGGKEGGVELDVERLAARLGDDEAAVSFRRFARWREEVEDELDSTGQPALRETSVASLCAFVVRSSKAAGSPGPTPASLLTLVDLGPIAPIEAAARAWREGLGVASDSRGVSSSPRAGTSPSVLASGVWLRERILDPLQPALTGAKRIVVVLDDVLHLVPFDALPLDEKTLVGDRWRIETRTTLTELLLSTDPFEETGELVAFGDVEYEANGGEDEGRTSGASEAAAAPAAADVESHSTDTGKRSSLLRGGAWAQGFSALPGTGTEVRGIARCFASRFRSDSAPELCEQEHATRERLLELAPKARYLHIATHGWFAPESIRSWSDPVPLDRQSGLGARLSGEEQVRGMSPMLLCGLALAGANLPEDAVGRAPGLVTADELATLDLTNCELVVLSACDTNVGERRAGQGVASLQKALQMAGARSVITSLWKVPDEATKELMLDFYRRLWVEKKPKHEALWEAKTKLREAKDERGAPLYATRDWAAWVLTGAPD